MATSGTGDTTPARSVDELKADCASLRRVAQQLRADRNLSSALQCEAILREREADLANALARGGH